MITKAVLTTTIAIFLGSILFSIFDANPSHVTALSAYGILMYLISKDYEDERKDN